MDWKHRAQVAFHLTRSFNGKSPEPLARLGLRPALFARYRDLTRLRYDYPVCLMEGGGVRSLSGLMNDVLRELAPEGSSADRLRANVLQLETEIRTRMTRQAPTRLSVLWSSCAAQLGPDAAEDLRAARKTLEGDGEVVDCQSDLPSRWVVHLWRDAVKAQSRVRLEALDRLILDLTNILRAHVLHTAEGCVPERLKASFGRVHHETFDFQAMSTLLRKVSAGRGLSEARRTRISRVVDTLRKHRPLFEAAENQPPFEGCEEALAHLRQQMPAMADFAKALAIGKLEVEGRYVEDEHDGFFQKLDQRALGADDLARFPTTLICLDAGSMDAGDADLLIEILASGLPVKVLVTCHDVLVDSPVGDGSLVLGARSARLASLALGLNEPFVLQSSASNLYALRDRVQAGLEAPGPALFSVFAPDSYLLGAAAMESRAFPAFVFDPAAGPDLASRFDLVNNPQPDRVWPVHSLDYQDADHQRVVEEISFTFADFVAADGRYASHFARVSRHDWDESQVAMSEWLETPPEGPGEKVPYVLMLDDDDVHQRVIVDDAVVRAAARCLKGWATLQELGELGRAVAAPPAVEAPIAQTPAEAPGPEAPAAQPAAEATPAAPPPAVERDPDEPYIETPRCSSCDECITLNNRMFSYNENKQAYIKDLSAGTYRQLVEAAESCQVAIIHPGKPKNPDEPDIEELLARAEPFA
ncbi:MAG: hypothetical protein HY319_23090 [Armatimonadetes bacterium]|nr:hypothetical protein [Armatimonadota bacterium]